ncbi:thiamine diphosphokinase [Salsipaludibacter albus]|uniref:thiamine diphosphokinase n=1 Tax=Salsipaludibacter albus TaxID=2849650 RepID=UPI001EE436A0|nr:thiamine diphosphokinase [Salsipaludibacter albus]MBY5162489.1 thiamine diphosphokinase [Salsipaludibacter albus]
MVSTAVITAGGDVTTVLALARFAAHLPDSADDVRVIAADQGLALADRLDLDVDVLVGDLDSVDPEQVSRAVAAGIDVRRHSTDKDATDLDLALDLALAGGARHIVVCDGGGDRFDHQLANVLVAARAARHARVTVVTTQAVVSVITDARELRGSVGDVVTLLPVFGRVDGIATTGLLYQLSDESLVPGSSRGVSNELVAPEARVTIEAGTLLAVQPGR